MHAEGDWNYEYDVLKDHYEIYTIDKNDAAWLIAIVCGAGRPDIEHDTAVLIAKAPELLTACKEGLRHCGEYRTLPVAEKMRKIFEAAIEKA